MNESDLLQPTFAPGDVMTLLQAGEVELVSVQRKEALLSQGRSYGTLLTPEGPPTALQQQTYAEALARSGAHIGVLLARLSHTLLSSYPHAVYVSLARAGTPVGCVLRRLALLAGREVPHYTLSIIRGEGIDREALRRIRWAHPQATLVFIDGWSGKGAIAQTLQDSIDFTGSWTLALLSDPAGLAEHAATFEDLLLPHAALNATVSGLLSRTFTQGPGQLHAARLEAALEPYDVSRVYVDMLTDLAVGAEKEPVVTASRPLAPVQSVLELAQSLGAHDPNLVKPSVGEATRVFLRRTPAHLMLRDAHHPDTAHLRTMARVQNVPISVHPALPYLAAALIKSRESL